MNTIHRINNALAQILAFLNVAAAVAAAAVLCGLLARLINTATYWPSLSGSATDWVRAVWPGRKGHLPAISDLPTFQRPSGPE